MFLKSGAKLLLFFEVCKKNYLKNENRNSLYFSDLHFCIFEKCIFGLKNGSFGGEFHMCLIRKLFQQPLDGTLVDVVKITDSFEGETEDQGRW